jgi:hypothetical protein
MPIYAVIRKTDQAEVYRYEASQPVEWQGFEFATHDHNEQPAEEPEAPPVVVDRPEDWWVTKRSFWNRFPMNNEIAMRAVMNGNSPALLAAGLQRLRARVDGSPHVDLKLQETREGVLWLGSTSVPTTATIDGVALPLRLTAPQVTAVLDVKPNQIEVFRGN